MGGNHEAIIDPATFDYVQAEMVIAMLCDSTELAKRQTELKEELEVVVGLVERCVTEKYNSVDGLRTLGSPFSIFRQQRSHCSIDDFSSILQQPLYGIVSSLYVGG